MREELPPRHSKLNTVLAARAAPERSKAAKGDEPEDRDRLQACCGTVGY